MSKRAAATPLLENEHVKELLEILRSNNIAANDLTEVIKNVTSMGNEINKAITEVSALRRELTALREEQAHPMKSMLAKAADSLMSKLGKVKAGIGSLKNKIIDGCKRAVDSFKDRGVSALSNIAVYFNIKSELESVRNNLNDAITEATSKIAKIEAASEQYHTAGLAVRNIGRAITGREQIPEIKPNGKLARLVETPFRSEVRHLSRSLNRANKALAGLDRLEKAAAKRAEQDRPSTLENMKNLQEVVNQRKKEAHAVDKEKKLEAAI